MLKRIMLTTDTVGGVWRYSIELARGFTECGARVSLVTLGPPPSDSQRAEAGSISRLRLVTTDLPLDWLADSPAQLADAANALVRLAERMRAESVHLHTPALVGDAAWPVPVVAAVHSCVGTWWRAVRGGELPTGLAWRADAVASGIAVADAVIAPSRSFAAALSTYYGCSRPIHAVLNGRRAVVSEAKRNRHAFTAGRLWDPGKNIATVDAAASYLDLPVLAAGPVVGPNGDGNDFQHLHLLGQLDEAAMADQYGSAAVFVSMARYEPFGLAVLEAAQAGCALVLSDIPTFRELWDCAAIFVDPRDADGLAEVLHSLTRLPARCAHLGDLAQQRAASLGLERMVAATWRLHQDLRRQPIRLAA